MTDPRILKVRKDITVQSMTVLALAIMVKMGVEDTKRMFADCMEPAFDAYEATLREVLLDEIHGANKALNEAVARKGGV